MRTIRVGKALAGLALFLAATLSHAQSEDAATGPAASEPAGMDASDGVARNLARRAAAEHALKNHRDGTRVSAAIVATPVNYPVAQALAAPGVERNGALKGWVLLLMGAFLIATISQRRYQALSDF